MVSETVEEKSPSKVIGFLKEFSLGILSLITYICVFVMGALAGILFILWHGM